MSGDELFKQAMQGVKPLSPNNKHSHRPPTSVKRDLPIDNSPEAPLSDGMFADAIYDDEPLFFARSGVQPKTIANLKRGKVAIESSLDLHGMTVEQARLALFHFLEEAFQSGLRCILVVHGKGGKQANTPSVLKSRVNSWLPQTDMVLAFASAQPKHGGTGAVYVLLKRQKHDEKGVG